jgi:hypothetical protein
MELTAKGLSCGGLQSIGVDAAPTAPFIQTFPDLFPLPGVRPPECAQRESCLATPACYQPLLGRQLQGFATEGEALEHALASPESVDAILMFGDVTGDLRFSYDIRVNHTLVHAHAADLHQ